MEFFVILIVVVVLFNLIGSLMGKGQQKQAPVNRPGPPPHRFRVTYEEPDRYKEREQPVQAAPVMEEKAAVEPERPVMPPENRPAADTGKVAASVQQLFVESDRLVAGFIFNEIMQPPRGLRRYRDN